MATDRGEYRPMFCRILNGPDFRRLSGIARACLWPLKLRLPSPGIGVIPALVAALSEDAAFPEEQVRAALEELEARPSEGPSEVVERGVEDRPPWVRRSGSLVWLVRGLEFEPTLNPNDPKHRLHVQRAVAAHPTVGLIEDYKSRYALWFDRIATPTPLGPSVGASNGLTRGSEGSSKGLRSKSPSPSPSTKSKQIRAPSPLFEQAWAAYPSRPNNSKAQALRAWNARAADGEPEVVMLTGTIAYAGYVQREGTDPKYVKLASTFYGPDQHYRSDFSTATPQRSHADDLGLEEPEPNWIDAPTDPDEIARLKAHGFH